MKAGIATALIAQLALSLASPAIGTHPAGPTVLGFGSRLVVKSPDGRWSLTALGDDTDIWLTLRPAQHGAPIRLLQIIRSCEVLWRGDSKVFAIVDARYANHYFLLVGFAGGHDKSPIVDLSPALEAAIRQPLRKRFDVDRIYVKVLRWLPDGDLLVGVNAVIFKHVEPLPAWQPGQELYHGYVIDPQKRQVIRELDEAAMLSEYGVNLEKETW